MGPCKPCLKGIQSHHGIHKTMVAHIDCAHGHIFSDICRLLATQSQNGHNHLITFVDDHTHEESIHRPHNKLQVRQALKALVFRAGPSTRQMAQVFCSNGSSKCMAGHLQEVPHHATPLHNASLTHTLDSITPKDAFSGNKLDIFQLRVLSCKVFMHENMHGKPNAHLLTCTFLRLAHNNSACHLIHKPSHHLIGSHTVILNEGGPTHHHHYHHHYLIILNHDGTPTMPNNNTSATTPSLPPANSITALHPRHTTHIPVHPHHMVSPYNARCTAHTPVCNDDPHYIVLPHSSHNPCHMVSPCRSWQTDHATANAAHAANPKEP